MGVGKRQQAIRAMRGQMSSPGRPSVGRREDRVRFWEAIARGVSSEDAAAVAGVSPAVGSRWFRQAGGMPPIMLAPLSGRYLSFAEREEIAILRAQGLGVREIARRAGPLAVDDLARAAPQRRRPAVTRLAYRATTAQWHAERRAGRPKVGQARGEPARCASTCRTGWPARSPGQTARLCRARMSAGSGGGTGVAPTGAGPGRGARSRSRTGSGSTSPMMSPCGSRTRRSTRRCTSRAAGRCAAS